MRCSSPFSSSPTNRLKGYVAVAATLLLWSTAVVFIKMLSWYYDVYTQNFYRYLSAAALLWTLAKLRGASRVPPLAKLLVPSLLVFSFQMLAVSGIYLTTPTTAALLMRLNVVFVNALAYALLGEERRLVSSRQYLTGLALAMAGAVGLSVEDPSTFTLDMGALMVLAGTIFWASYTVTVRMLVKCSDPLAVSSRVFSVATLLLLGSAALFGDLSSPFRTPAAAVALLLVSGSLCVGLGNYMYYIALRELGASLTASLQLLSPLLTALTSHLLLGETLTLRLASFGALLLLGCALVLARTTLSRSSNT